jgi:glycosyltransferase involved in cell wall biosynthesis
LAQSVGARNRVRVVHNGVDVPLEGMLDRRVRDLRRRGPVICAVTQLRPGKGVETLLDALPTLRRRCPEAQLALVGDGPLWPSLAARAAQLGSADVVHFLGEHPDPVAALRESDVFVLPSWAESFPYVILEAMSVALPIVASDVGGVREAIEHDRSGLLVPPRDPVALGEALARVCTHQQLARGLGDAARARVAGTFTVRRMVRAIATVYEEVLADD